MKITGVRQWHCDGGWRTLSFLKVTTDAGLSGWSEFHEGAAAPGLGAIIERLGEKILGMDPCRPNPLMAGLRAAGRAFPAGLFGHAAAAIENACLDILARSLGIPVHGLFGGAYHQQLPVYWSQCGTLRTQHAQVLGVPPLQTLADVEALGREVKQRGFGALKTNVLIREACPATDSTRLTNYRPGFGAGPQHPSLNMSPRLPDDLIALMEAFRAGAGPDVRLMLDLNFNFRPESVKRIARALEPLDLEWLECDLRNVQALTDLRHATSTPIASLETMLGRQALHPYLNAVDVAIIDPQWNGYTEALQMASLAELHEVNVASHNYHGPLSTLIGVHFSMSIPNSRYVEWVVDQPAWLADLLVHPPTIVNGLVSLPDGAGWGSDINEEVLLAHPPKQNR